MEVFARPREWRSLIALPLLFCLAIPLTASAQPSVSAAVRNELEQSGRALVIIGVQIPVFDRARDLSPAAIAAQRQSIRQAIGSVLNAVDTGLIVGHQFQTLPYFSAAVDARGLAALSVAPGVTSIVLDLALPPALGQSVPRIGAPASWAAGANGAGWTVAVLDTGVETSHPMLAGRTITESCFSNAGGLAGGTSLCPDGTFASVLRGSGINCTGVAGCDHGTHVAGIAVGSGLLNGVAPGAFLMASQVFTRVEDPATCGGPVAPCVLSYTSDRIATLEHIFRLAGHENGNRVAAVNMSVGSHAAFPTPCDTVITAAERTAIDNLRSIGIPTVISAGNGGFSDRLSSPACISSAISVGSTTNSDEVSGFSNAASFLSLLAPGGDGTSSGGIRSAVIGSTTGIKSGTSMSAPHVAGAWAVLKQALPFANVDQVLSALRSTGTTVVDRRSGVAFPRINVNDARLALIANLGTVPGQVSELRVTGADLKTISWRPPLTGGTPTHYVIRAGTTAGGSQLGTHNLGNITSLGPVSLPDGRYFITITAHNAVGAGAASVETEFTVGATEPPVAPTTVNVSVQGSQVMVNWSGGSGATSFQIVGGTTSGGNQLGSFDVGRVTSVSGNLAPGTYFIYVIARNPLGQSSSAVRSFTVP